MKCRLHGKNSLKGEQRNLVFFSALSQAIFFLAVTPFISSISKKRKKEIYSQYHLDESPVPSHLVKRILYINTNDGRALLRELQADLIIVNGTRIISQKSLESVPSTFINIHTGITPLFRGVHGGYWSVATGRKNLFGTTIHYVDAGVDTGGIIEQIFTEPGKKDNFYTYPYLQYAVCLPVLKQIVESFIAGKRPGTKQPVTTESALWFHPTLFQWLSNLKRTFIFVFPVLTAQYIF